MLSTGGGAGLRPGLRDEKGNSIAEWKIGDLHNGGPRSGEHLFTDIEGGRSRSVDQLRDADEDRLEGHERDESRVVVCRRQPDEDLEIGARLGVRALRIAHGGELEGARCLPEIDAGGFEAEHRLTAGSAARSLAKFVSEVPEGAGVFVHDTSKGLGYPGEPHGKCPDAKKFLQDLHDVFPAQRPWDISWDITRDMRRSRVSSRRCSKTTSARRSDAGSS